MQTAISTHTAPPALKDMDERTRFAAVCSAIISGLRLMGVPMDDKDKAAAAVAPIVAYIADDYPLYTVYEIRRAFECAARGVIAPPVQHYNVISARYVLAVLNSYDRHRRDVKEQARKRQLQRQSEQWRSEWERTRINVLCSAWVRARWGCPLRWGMPHQAIIQGRLMRFGYPDSLPTDKAAAAIAELIDDGCTMMEWMHE